jgi:hypothetical protein
MIFIAAIPLGFQIANQKTRRHFKALEDGGQTKFSENLCPSPFN